MTTPSECILCDAPVPRPVSYLHLGADAVLCEDCKSVIQRRVDLAVRRVEADMMASVARRERLPRVWLALTLAGLMAASCGTALWEVLR